MSVAAPTSTEAKSVSSPPSLWTTGLVGAVFVLAALAVIFYGVPQLWQMSIGAWLAPNKFLDYSFRLVAQVLVFVVLAMLGVLMVGPNPPKGLRGSVFLGIATIIVGFFLGRGTLMVVEHMAHKFDFGHLVSLLFIGVCLFFFYKFLASDRFPRWSVGLEAAGWFDVKAYKRQQGVRVRRLTIFGIILLLDSGVYAMVHNNAVPPGNLEISLPLTDSKLVLLPDAQYTVPIALLVLSVWFSRRIVNYPVFADFLIATEAEINKVSWTPRARLIQDTIVVLITVFLITLFLFLVDVFWGWILSREFIGVLPSQAETGKKNETKRVNNDQY
jgi:preprotein translocase SecE subunit